MLTIKSTEKKIIVIVFMLFRMNEQLDAVKAVKVENKINFEPYLRSLTASYSRSKTNFISTILNFYKHSIKILEASNAYNNNNNNNNNKIKITKQSD
jgi:hypothetical protein